MVWLSNTQPNLKGGPLEAKKLSKITKSAKLLNHKRNLRRGQVCRSLPPCPKPGYSGTFDPFFIDELEGFSR